MENKLFEKEKDLALKLLFAYKQRVGFGKNEPMDGDAVEVLIDAVRVIINEQEGNV